MKKTAVFFEPGSGRVSFLRCSQIDRLRAAVGMGTGRHRPGHHAVTESDYAPDRPVTADRVYKLLYNPIMKPLVWLGSSRDDVRGFSREARQEAGYELYQIQKGLDPSDWRPMPSIGAGVVEIRVHAEKEYRVLYIAKFAEAIYVLHTFAKRTRQTARGDVELTRARLKQLIATRKQT